jgi:hypothetical protein
MARRRKGLIAVATLPIKKGRERLIKKARHDAWR